jgi:ElaA protein
MQASDVFPPRWRCASFEALSSTELQRIHIARQQVFVVEQNCAFQDADLADERSAHLCAWSDAGELLAYARIVAPGVKYAEPSIGRVLTTAAARGTGIGRELLRRALAQAAATYPGQGVRISAQHRLERFYTEAGFVSVGEPYLEDDLPHIEMWRAASRAAADGGPPHV